MSDDSKSDQVDRSRRRFLKTSGTTAAAGVISAYLPAHASGAVNKVAQGEINQPAIEGAVPITLRINGKDYKLSIDPDNAARLHTRNGRAHRHERIYFEHFWNDFAADPKHSVSEADRRFYAHAYAQPGAMRAGFEVFRNFRAGCQRLR